MRAQMKQSAGFASESADWKCTFGRRHLHDSSIRTERTFCDKSYEEYNKKYEAAHGKSLEPLYCPTIDDVFEQLCTNEACEYAVVPVENMLDGYVQRTLDLLLEKNVYIVDENQVAVQFRCLPIQRR